MRQTSTTAKASATRAKPLPSGEMTRAQMSRTNCRSRHSDDLSKETVTAGECMGPGGQPLQQLVGV
jgi:hypothetical protein